eukprot:9238937-Pyramimonas_sp.AAC.1
MAQKFQKCKLNKHAYTNCVSRCTKTENGGAAMDQGELHHAVSPHCPPRSRWTFPNAKASNLVSDTFVSLRASPFCRS